MVFILSGPVEHTATGLWSFNSNRINWNSSRGGFTMFLEPAALLLRSHGRLAVAAFAHLAGAPQAASECHQQPTQEQQGNDRPGKSKHLDAKGGIDAIIVKVASGLDVRGSVHGSCGSSKDEGKTRKEGNNGRTNAGAEGKG